MAYILSEEELNELRQELETTTDEKRRKEIEQDLEYGCRDDGTTEWYRQLKQEIRISRLRTNILAVIIAVLFMYLSLCAIQIAPEPEVQETTFIETMEETLWKYNIFRIFLGK